MIKQEFINEDKIKANLEETEKLRLEYEYLNTKLYDRNGKRMDEIEKLLDEKNKEFFNLID
jgi:hypothetical protein